jgi:D-3-phosphoglycerate dehydrogenase / 2-oxoglutarate reductase
VRKIAVITPVKHLPRVPELLETKGEIFYLENGTKEEVRRLILEKEVNTLVCNPNKQGYKIDEELLADTGITLVNTCSTGLNHIDLEYCLENNIEIQSHTKDTDLIKKLPSTAELAFGLLLDLLRNISKSNKEVKENLTWDYTSFVGHQLKGYKVGIVGYGRLGTMMHKYLKAFGADVRCYDPYVDPLYVPGKPVNSLESLFDYCDAISLHVHVTDETRGFITEDLLSRNIKYLVNTSRGEIVDENAIVKSLKEGKLKGYATDVIADEFGNIQNSPLLKLQNQDLNIIFTPHIGGMTIEGQTLAFTHSINKL